MPTWPLRNNSAAPSRRSAEHGFTSSWRYAQQGFTLIEMLVVLTVIGLVAAVAAQRMGHRPAGLIREEAEAKLDLALDTARREAGRTGVIQQIDTAALIPGSTLSGALPGPAAVGPGGRSLILVYPDGSSNGGVVTAGGRTVATIDWLTGEARDAS